jgi:hypothetical protein
MWQNDRYVLSSPFTLNAGRPRSVLYKVPSSQAKVRHSQQKHIDATEVQTTVVWFLGHITNHSEHRYESLRIYLAGVKNTKGLPLCA